MLLRLGYPEQGLTRLHEALTLASELAHPFYLVYAHFQAAYFYARGQQGAAAQRHAEIALALCSKHGFAQRLAQSTMVRGWALAAQGRSAEGIAQIRQGLVAGRETGATLGESFYMMLLAEAYRNKGQLDEGLRVVAEALECADQHGTYGHMFELLQLKGEFLVLQAGDRASAPTTQMVTAVGAAAEAGGAMLISPLHAEAETCLRQALEGSRRTQAKLTELQAAVGLSRLWQQQGKRAAARELLADIYGWFTECFDTPALQDAKALLETLSEELSGISTARRTRV